MLQKKSEYDLNILLIFKNYEMWLLKLIYCHNLSKRFHFQYVLFDFLEDLKTFFVQTDKIFSKIDFQ